MERLIDKHGQDDVAWIKGHLSDSCTDMCEEVNGECWRCDIMVCMERLADYEDAEEQGRLIELPLKYGEHIFEAYESGHKVIEWTVEGFNIKPDSTYICIGHGVSINAAHLGDTLFKTREEAETKLKEMEEWNSEDGKV